MKNTSTNGQISQEELTALCERARELYLNGKVAEARKLLRNVSVKQIRAEAYGPDYFLSWRSTHKKITSKADFTDSCYETSNFEENYCCHSDWDE